MNALEICLLILLAASLSLNAWLYVMLNRMKDYLRKAVAYAEEMAGLVDRSTNSLRIFSLVLGGLCALAVLKRVFGDDDDDGEN